jgi:O-methyltransferase involved in polyketide biosynthesis
VVLESVPASLGARVADALRIPVVGIGARPDVDAQILVWQDMAGLTPGPAAPRFVRDNKRGAVQRVREGAPPRGWSERVDFEMARASSEVIVPRTVAIDDAVRARRVPQLVIIGAGLDDRAWRMSELADVEVFEVDRPASQRDKRSRVGDLQPLVRSMRYLARRFASRGPRRRVRRSGSARGVPGRGALVGR